MNSQSEQYNYTFTYSDLAV